MLTPSQRTEFARRDVTQVAASFGRLPANWAQDGWLSIRNRYAKNCVKQLTDDFHPPVTVTHKHLAEYIAASTILHLFDGWSYLGRALHSLFVGDHDCARHLGYYAELRGAMSLLASQGIGVFDREHVIVSAGGRCLQMPPPRHANRPNRPRGPGTHRFVWDALEEWAQSASSSPQILGLISGGGSPLEDWLHYVGIIPAFAAHVARDWLLGWGFDISRLAADRDARNVSSYRPTSVSTARPLDARSIAEFILELWLLSQPTQSNAFATLDEVLIKATVHRAFRATSGYTPGRARRQFRNFVLALLAGLQPQPRQGIAWQDFLLDLTQPGVDILGNPAANNTPTHTRHVIQVASRAFLLLRIAAGLTRQLVSNLPEAALVDLEFWISTSGEDRALWPPNGRPFPLIDLWQDISAARQQMLPNLAQINSFNAIWATFSAPAGLLTSCERVGLWSLGL